MIGTRYLVPVVNLFPIWKFGPITDVDGHIVREGWYPERVGQRTFATYAEAEKFVEAVAKESLGDD